jgi:hypothetical protein
MIALRACADSQGFSSGSGACCNTPLTPIARSSVAVVSLEGHVDGLSKGGRYAARTFAYSPFGLRRACAAVVPTLGWSPRNAPGGSFARASGLQEPQPAFPCGSRRAAIYARALRGDRDVPRGL